MARKLAEGLGIAVAKRTVLRKKKNGHLESWKNVADRVALGNSLLAYNLDLTEDEKIEHQAEEYSKLKQHIGNASLLMSGRHLQHGDETQPNRNQEIFTNCSSSASSFILFYLLMNGSGVGRSYDDDLMITNWSGMPDVRLALSSSHKDFNYEIMETPEVARKKYRNAVWFEVPDTREGWAKAVEKLEVMTYEGTGGTLVLDFSKIRPSGSPIKGMQGRPASGPAPLMRAFNNIATIKNSGMPNWEATMWVDHYLSECVLVGGARRSARISLKTWKDKDILDFITIKNGGLLWSANNSVAVDSEFWKQDTKEKKKILRTILQTSYESGEPGFVNQDKLVQKNDGLEVFDDGKFAESNKYKPGTRAVEYLSHLAEKALNKQFMQIPNPCFRGDTLIKTKKGDFPIKDLVGKTVEIWNGEEWSIVDNFRITSHDQPVLGIVVKLGDRKEEIWVTAYHNMILVNGDKIPAAMICVGDKLLGDPENGKVVDIKPYQTVKDVYCCTEPKRNRLQLTNGIITGNCGEATLNVLAGYCVLADLVPYFAEDDDDAEDAFRVATRALIRVNTMDSLYKKEVERTNRIGIGITGIHEYAWKRFGYSWHDLVNEGKSMDFWLMLSRFKRAVDDEATKYSKKIGMKIPHTNVVVKPSGCGTGDVTIRTKAGIRTLKEIFDKNCDVDELKRGDWIKPKENIVVYDKNDNEQEVTKLYYNGEDRVFEITMDDGQAFKFTGNHKFLTKEGWIELQNLKGIEELGDKRIKSIRKLPGKHKTYDIEVANTHSYQLSNGAVVHNSVSKLFSLSEGVHLPAMKEYIRWVQFRSDDPLIKEYADKGYPTKKLKTYKDVVIVGFPTQPEICRLGMGDKLVTAGEATMEEQYTWLMLLEKYWITGVDNVFLEEDEDLMGKCYAPLTSETGGQISYTLKYNPHVVDYAQYSKIVRKYQPLVRCCSVLPQAEKLMFEYLPEQAISRTYYNQLVRNIEEKIREDIDKVHIDCAAGGCPIDYKDNV